MRRWPSLWTDPQLEFSFVKEVEEATKAAAQKAIEQAWIAREAREQQQQAEEQKIQERVSLLTDEELKKQLEVLHTGLHTLTVCVYERELKKREQMTMKVNRWRN